MYPLLVLNTDHTNRTNWGSGLLFFVSADHTDHTDWCRGFLFFCFRGSHVSHESFYPNTHASMITNKTFSLSRMQRANHEVFALC